MAALAARNLAAFPLVDIQTVTFEDWAVAMGQYDLVLSATAFHWVSPEVRYVKAAQALAAGGWLALFWNMEDDDESVLGQRLQAVYDKHAPSSPEHPYGTPHPAGRSKARALKIARRQEEIDQSGLFGSVSVLQFPWTQLYTTEQYLQLLETYSDHRVMPPEDKRELFGGIARVLTEGGGGRTKPYLTVLYLARMG